MKSKQDKGPAKRGRKPSGSDKARDTNKRSSKKPLPFEKFRDPSKKSEKPARFEKDRDTGGKKPAFEKDRDFDRKGKRPPFNKDRDTAKRGRKPADFDKDRAPKSRSAKPIAHGKDDGLQRLNKALATSGICSRREADEYIKAGLVKVNNKVVTEMGVKVGPGDEVKFNDERIRKEKNVYVLLNKPKDFVTTMEDPHAKKIVIDLVKNACKERIYPVGRLDRNTTGVLLFTNDGDLTKKLTHPKYKKKKIYHVFLDQDFTKADMTKIANGVKVDDTFVETDSISFVNPDDKSEIGIEIHSGQNRIVRRLFESLDYRVRKLDRVFFAGLTKKNLARGKWRFLTEKEVAMLKMGNYK